MNRSCLHQCVFDSEKKKKEKAGLGEKYMVERYAYFKDPETYLEQMHQGYQKLKTLLVTPDLNTSPFTEASVY